MKIKSKVGSRKAKVNKRLSFRHAPVYRGCEARINQTLAIRHVCCAFLLCSAGALHAAEAQQYPSRPIRLVLGFAPGGASDTMARVIATRLTESLGQPMVIDNRAGAGGNIAAEIVAHSNPD